MKYDEKFLYFYAEGFDPEKETLYIPLDTTPESGSKLCENYSIRFDRPCDFIIILDGREDSRIQVQERYEVLKEIYWESYYVDDPFIDPPAKDSPDFVNINLAMKLGGIVPNPDENAIIGENYETGKLRYGNANPESPEFDSLADYCFTEDGAEIRIPWQLLNFSNPSEMMIHDDYYENYGIENLEIDRIYAGAVAEAEKDETVRMSFFRLEGWGKNVTYHERLKESYYILRDYWNSLK